MDRKEFFTIRKRLKKTQKEIAALLGVSKKTVESYEQGLRNIPVNIGRILYYLLFKMNIDKLDVSQTCWGANNCPEDVRDNCVAWLGKEGFFCWFITGKTCALKREPGDGKDATCFNCDYFQNQLTTVMAG